MTKMKPSDPAYWMLSDGVTSTPTVYRAGCYICDDPEFAQMGLPLCYPCVFCGAHVPADDTVCDNGHEQPMCYEDEVYLEQKYGLKIDEWKSVSADR